MYSDAFEAAVAHAMLYEVGGFFKLTPEVEAGLISTPAQRKAVGYVNDPLDAGGETKFGVAKNANPDLDITNLTWEQAKGVYYSRYWLAGHCESMPPRIAILHFDGCVNHGVTRATKFLQEAAGVTPDGVLGPMSLEAINSADQIDLCKNICDNREEFYNRIVENKPSQSRFLNGWLRRINEIEGFTINPMADFD